MPTLPDYDAVPYEDCPLAESHPDYLSVIGRLFGVAAASPDNCRLLELGCASGGNLVPMAYYWPGSTYVGVELSEKQAAEGNRLIRELELDNITILHADILSLDESLGMFDYIIVHGVYSWVPVAVQEHILKLCRQLLGPNGIAYISYNTFPGWNLRLSIREMMLYHSRHATSPKEKLDQCVDMLQMLAKGIPETSNLSEKWMKKEVTKLLSRSPNYLLHEYLTETNSPVYFHEFMERVSRHQLQYLGDADLYSMLGSSLSKEAEEELDKYDDFIEYEQYLDFLYVRFFRTSLLCHDHVDLIRDLDLDKLREWYFRAQLKSKEEIDLFSTEAQVFVDQSGASFDISHPLTKAAVVELAYIHPNSHSWSDLLHRAQTILEEVGSPYAKADADELLGELFNLFLSQGLHLSAVKRTFNDTFTGQPKANQLARIYGRHNKCCVASVHHANLRLDTMEQYLLTLLNGENTLDVIQQAIENKLEHDEVFHQQIVNQGISGSMINTALKSTIEQTLYHFAGHGLLES
ncbi:MAG: class I SAM-dependent methyltransferase [Gammaproteobacteria bacterium]|nr:class I SAM-dependent methyltransferase [Gammaproteobacteria bacterium]